MPRRFQIAAHLPSARLLSGMTRDCVSGSCTIPATDMAPSLAMLQRCLDEQEQGGGSWVLVASIA